MVEILSLTHFTNFCSALLKIEKLRALMQIAIVKSLWTVVCVALFLSLSGGPFSFVFLAKY